MAIQSLDLIASVRAYLVADSGVSALTSSRIYANRARNDAALPYVVLTLAGMSPVERLEAGRTQYREARLQVDCYGAGTASARAVENATQAALDGVAGETWSGIVVGCCQLIDARSGREASAAGGDEGVARYRNDYRLTFRGN